MFVANTSTLQYLEPLNVTQDQRTEELGDDLYNHMIPFRDPLAPDAAAV